MKVTSETTVAELMSKFPNGFAVGPGCKEHPGELSRILFISSHLRIMLQRYPMIEGNQGYIVVDMEGELK